MSPEQSLHDVEFQACENSLANQVCHVSCLLAASLSVSSSENLSAVDYLL